MPADGIPVIKWGTFYDRSGVIHVAPAIESYLMFGHKLSMKCNCCPRIDEGKNYRIVIHEVIH
jgi:hypothetical protein